MLDVPSGKGFLEIQGAPLYYEAAGQGYPLLLLHAGVADSRMWNEQVAVFSRYYTTIRYDLRGFGRSVFPQGPFAHHDDPAALLSSLNVSKAHVIGISFGGKVALDFTLAHPELVASLILIAPSVGGHNQPPEVLHLNEQEEALLERGDLEGATELNLRLWVDGPKRTPEQVDPVVRQRIHDMQYHALAIPQPTEAEEIALRPPAIERLSEVHVPTLIIVGDYDILDKQALAEQLTTEIPMAKIVRIPQVAHMLTMEKPEEFNDIVLEFLRKQ